MSHFIGLMFGGNEDVLDKYDENIEVEPYVRYTKDDAVNEVRERKIDNYERAVKLKENGNTEDWVLKTVDKGIYISYEDAWKEAKEWGYELDEDDNLLSTYNPNSKWDWYTVGGRWGGYLPLKIPDSSEESILDFSNECTIKEVDWDKYFKEHEHPFCFITVDGEWHEKADMGWWGMTANDKEEDKWNEEFKNYLNSLDSDTLVTAIDFHI